MVVPSINSEPGLGAVSATRGGLFVRRTVTFAPGPTFPEESTAKTATSTDLSGMTRVARYSNVVGVCATFVADGRKTFVTRTPSTKNLTAATSKLGGVARARTYAA